jgi:glucose/galactose transporter
MQQANALHKKEVFVSMLLIGILFFVFGSVTWVNAILIPYFKIACELSNFQSYLVAFAFYISYLIMAVPSSLLLKRIGFKKGMMLGFFIMAAGAFVFVIAAFFRQYEIFLIGLFALGTGLTILQTAANPYVTILGPRERAAQRISIVGICNKTAGILAPLLFAALILRTGDSELFKQIPSLQDVEKSAVLNALIRRVEVPYILVGIVLLLLGILIRYSPLPEIDTDQEAAFPAEVNAGKSSILHFPHLILGAIAIFFHVGTQVIAIDTIIGFAASMNIQLNEAKVFPSYILFATITGYIIGICCIPRYISQLNALRVCTVLGLILSMLVLFAKGQIQWLHHKTDISLCFLVLLGLANSLIWAGIWPLALHELGRFTKKGASLLVMGLCGNAILPLIYGFLADRYNVRAGYWVLVPCYIYLIFYAGYGYRLRAWKRQQKLVLATS